LKRLPVPTARCKAARLENSFQLLPLHCPSLIDAGAPTGAKQGHELIWFGQAVSARSGREFLRIQRGQLGSVLRTNGLAMAAEVAQGGVRDPHCLIFLHKNPSPTHLDAQPAKGAAIFVNGYGFHGQPPESL